VLPCTAIAGTLDGSSRATGHATKGHRVPEQQPWAEPHGRQLKHGHASRPRDLYAVPRAMLGAQLAHGVLHVAPRAQVLYSTIISEFLLVFKIKLRDSIV
jgi:hypothetical protein